MRKDHDDDLATALPPNLTVEIELPAPSREVADEVGVLDVLPATSDGNSTVSIEILPADLEPIPVEADPGDSGPEEPVAVVPLPEPAATPAVATSVRAKRRARHDPTRPDTSQPDTPRSTKPGRAPAPEGRWPEFVYAATFRLVNLGDSAAVRARTQLDRRIGRAIEHPPRFVPVLSRKGGVGKTTVTALLGMALADVRVDRVLAIDANPDRGTLADRFVRQTRSTVRDVVLHAPQIVEYDTVATYVSRDSTGLDVLASEADPLLADAFDGGGYHVVSDVVAPHYGVVVTDSGTGVVHSVVRATLQRADAVVVVSGGSIDEARLASETLTWLEANGYRDLVARCVVALNTSTQGTDLDRIDEIEAHFRSRVRAVVRIPYDPELAAGSVVRYDALRPFTRESARQLAALVVDGLGGDSS